MASYRYRAGIPSKFIEGSTINGGVGEIIVFSKPTLEDVALAEYVKDQGGCIVTDLCDPLVERRPHYRRMLELSNYVVCPTEVSRDLIKPYFDGEITVIPDPYEFEREEPHSTGNKFIWFGHKSNLPDIEPYRTIPDLRIISGPFDKVPDGVTFYSPENLRRGLLEADFCLLPTRPGSEYKSPNRLLNAIQMGVFPICDNHPSYREFRELVWVGSIPTGIKWAKKYASNELILKAQYYIEKYSPERIGEQWRDLLGSI